MKYSHLLLLASFLLVSCSETDNKALQASLQAPNEEIPFQPSNVDWEEFGNYWHQGKAEISTFKLSQARYGKMREGHSTLIYVTEPFLPKEQVKANSVKGGNRPVLKLNSTKKFLTGIYPYSLMTSVFSPLTEGEHAIKATFSAQEWCGQTYMQLNNRDQYEIEVHSYFEGMADLNLKLKKDYLENEIWTLLRLAKEELPIGELRMIPSMEFLRLHHREVKAYDAKAGLVEKDGMVRYTIEYPELERTLIINYKNEFPYTIESWEETSLSGFGENRKRLTTKAEKITTILSDYWNKNSPSDEVLREELGL